MSFHKPAERELQNRYTNGPHPVALCIIPQRFGPNRLYKVEKVAQAF